MKATTVLLPLLLCSCLKIPPSPPTYDGCTMIPDTYQKMAELTVDIDSIGEIPVDPAEALAYCEEKMTSRGWKIIIKTASPSTMWGRFATTLPGEIPLILLSSNWEDRPIARRAATMCHEAVHTYQFERQGTGVMAPIYALNVGTWAHEVPAYRVSIRIWADQNPDASVEDIEAQARSTMRNLYTKYKLNNMPERCAVGKGVAIIMQDHREQGVQSNE